MVKILRKKEMKMLLTKKDDCKLSLNVRRRISKRQFKNYSEMIEDPESRDIESVAQTEQTKIMQSD